MFVLALAACRPDDDRPPGRPPAGTAAPDCALDEDHALRGTCRGVSGAVTFSAPGEDDRVFAAAEGEVRFWGLVPDTDWTVTAGGATASLRTGPLPEAFARLTYQAEGALENALALPVTCPIASWIVVDPEGRIVHYDGLAEDRPGPISAFTVTEDGTFLVLVGHDEIREVAPTGEERLRIRRGDRPFHHAVARRDGLTWALWARESGADGKRWITDGVSVYDGDGAEVASADLDLFPRSGVEPWMTGGYWTAPFTPGAVDLSHANALDVAPDGRSFWVSFRHQHALARLSGDPGSARFGALELLAVGSTASPAAALAGPEVLAVEGGFSGQHDVSWQPGEADGVLTLLDNGWPWARPATVERYVLDEAAGTLTLAESWDTGLLCDHQGGARPLPDGGVLATCAPLGRVLAFAEGATEPALDAALACGATRLSTPQAWPFALPR